MVHNFLVLWVVAIGSLVDTTMTQNHTASFHTEHWVGRIHVTRSETPMQNKAGKRRVHS